MAKISYPDSVVFSKASIYLSQHYHQAEQIASFGVAKYGFSKLTLENICIYFYFRQITTT